jgi:hypothetical protein
MRSATLIALLAACGGSKQPTTTPVDPALGSTTHVVKPDSGSGNGGVGGSPATPADPNLAFRQHYVDPGGMWMPAQMTLEQHVDNFKKMGVKLDAKTLADPSKVPLAAVVSLGGCTGSFVSPDGLVVTNHHCVQGALQYGSNKDHDYITDGFVAKTKADELPAGPSQIVRIVQKYSDVTHEMRDGLDKIKDPIARKEASDKRLKDMIAKCEKDRPGIRCQVSGFFEGGYYQLIEALELRDVRVVYVPPRSVGNFGGEVDNWNWPRHTGDWSFFRAYIGPDGRAADYSDKNVPYKPAQWLKVSTAGVKPADFVMVTGYPGQTNRTITASQVHHDLEWSTPQRIAYYEERYALAEKFLSSDNKEVVQKATVTKQGLQNGLEKFRGELDGFKKNPDLIVQKDAADKKVRELAAQPGHEAQRARLDKLDALLADEFRRAPAEVARGNAFGGSNMMAAALSFTRWADERQKKDPERRPNFQQRDLQRAVANTKQLTKRYDRDMDRAFFRLALVRALQLPDADRPWLALMLNAKKGQAIDEAFIDKTLDDWYKAPALEDEKLRLDLLQNGTLAKLKAQKDPFVQAAQRVWPIVKAEDKKSDTRRGELLLVAPVYSELLKESLGGAVAPDANSTLRVTYGTVRSLHPESRESADVPFTIASQIVAKTTGKDPFDTPAKVVDAIKAKKFGPYGDRALGGELPIDFLSDLDITGGNSGSPTLNDRGELVGLAFDGNREGLASDVVFDGSTTRTIHVDARYMLWTMDLIDGAKHILTEMGVRPQFP